RGSFTFIVWTEAKDVVTGNGERGGSAALADNENIVSVGERFNHCDLGACLRADDNLHSAFIEVLDWPLLRHRAGPWQFEARLRCLVRANSQSRLTRRGHRS